MSYIAGHVNDDDGSYARNCCEWRKNFPRGFGRTGTQRAASVPVCNTLQETVYGEMERDTIPTENHDKIHNDANEMAGDKEPSNGDFDSQNTYALEASENDNHLASNPPMIPEAEEKEESNDIETSNDAAGYGSSEGESLLDTRTPTLEEDEMELSWPQFETVDDTTSEDSATGPDAQAEMMHPSAQANRDNGPTENGNGTAQQDVDYLRRVENHVRLSDSVEEIETADFDEATSLTDTTIDSL